MRPRYVWPSLTKTPVLITLSTTFSTVPDSSRADPAMTSGPVSISMATCASPPSGVLVARLNPRSDWIDGSCYAVGVRRHRLDRAPVLGVHQLDHFLRAHRVQPVGVRVDVLAHGRITSAAAIAHTRAAPLVAMYALAPAG